MGTKFDTIDEAIIAIQNQRAKPCAVSIWYMQGRGWLAALLDEHMSLVFGTTTWDYSPTALDAVTMLHAEIQSRESATELK